jgi:hypothetical protein
VEEPQVLRRPNCPGSSILGTRLVIRLVLKPSLQVKARHSSTQIDDQGVSQHLFVDEEGVSISVYPKDITDPMMSINGPADLKV